jgi:hypothetical protein
MDRKDGRKRKGKASAKAAGEFPCEMLGRTFRAIAHVRDAEGRPVYVCEIEAVLPEKLFKVRR